MNSVEESNDNVPSTSGFQTPPQQSAQEPTLPALTQGRLFRKMSSSDDEEDDGLCSIRKEALGQKAGGEGEAEPKGKLEEGLSLSRKRCSSEEPDAGFPKKRFKDADCDSGVVEGGDCGQLTDLYTELKYIEAFGCLEMVPRTKHRGVHTAPSTSYSDSNALTSHFEDRCSGESGSSHWTRETKLNISYRLHRNQSDIQFALVVYDNLTKRPTTRRNLINEFGSLEFERTPNISPPRKKNQDKTKKSVTAKKPLRF